MIGHLVIPGTHVHVQLAVLDNEGVREQLFVLRSLLVVLGETVADKRGEFTGKPRGWKFRRFFLDHFGEDFELRVAVFIGEGASGELTKGDSETPNVGANVIVGFVGIGRVYSFRSHIGSTAGTTSFSLRINKAT